MIQLMAEEYTEKSGPGFHVSLPGDLHRGRNELPHADTRLEPHGFDTDMPQGPNYISVVSRLPRIALCTLMFSALTVGLCFARTRFCVAGAGFRKPRLTLCFFKFIVRHDCSFS
jgi:hypothetical protein